MGAILCIALPVAYGSKRKPRPFKAAVMGIVFGVYFGLWLLFTVGLSNGGRKKKKNRRSVGLSPWLLPPPPLEEG